MNQDTICALATANGMGAIGIIRVSGNEAFSIVQKCFKGKTLAQQPSHTIHYGYIVDRQEAGSRKQEAGSNESEMMFNEKSLSPIAYCLRPEIIDEVMVSILKVLPPKIP